MKKNLLTTALTLTTAAIITAQPAMAMGIFYTEATYPHTATGAKAFKDIKTLKKGTAIAKNYVCVVELGDASIDAAAKAAGITQVHYVDIYVKSIFFFWKKIVTEVYGE
jgi:hypothetical protein